MRNLNLPISAVRKMIIPILVFILADALSAVNTVSIRGKILDETDVPVEAANVYLKGTIKGAATNEAGEFIITDVPAGQFRLTVAVIGYQLLEIPLTLSANDLDLGILRLKSVALQSQPIVVTAGRHEQQLQDVSVSVSMVTGQEIASRQAIRLDEALQYVSGLNLTGSQVSIRGSSGYSRGVGSRVLMLVDDVPYLTGDTKETNFNSLPVNQVDRIEIVKGSGSALYGSSAIGGVINVISKNITSEPDFNLNLYGGFYSPPHYPEWEWSDRTRYLSGLKVDYSKRSGNTGFRFGAGHDQGDGYKQNDWSRRYYVNGMVSYDFSPFRELKLSGTFMTEKHGSFLYWKDLSNALVPPDDQLGNTVQSQRGHLAGSYRQVLDDNHFYTVKAMWFHNDFDDNISGDAETADGNQSTSDFLDGIFQYNFSSDNHQLTTGAEINGSRVASNIFSDKSGYNGALFVQDEYTLNDRLTIVPGLRVDYFQLDGVGTDYQVNPKLGLVYRPGEFTALRATAGRGFRAPSIAEVFTSTTASGLRVIPNPDLKPERSVSAELGYNQFFGKNIFMDMAVFYNHFWDLIEGQFNDDGDIQFQNVTEAGTTGFEINFNLKAFSDKLSYRMGYTFVNARDISKDDYLIFRPRHLVYENMSYTWGDIQFGVDYRFISAWDRIDESMNLFIKDADARVPAHVLDLRLIYTFTLQKHDVQASLQANNLLQYHYIDLVGSIAPTRHFILALSLGM
ncbi:MAG: TonB-dependent receptor [Calditrichales bacterium]|nr:MAG: TonB-dependent receptor [Calditrichales bacterium]